MHFSSDETDEFNAGLATIGELTKTVSDRTPSDILAREEELFEASSYVSEDVVENSTRNTIEHRDETAFIAVLKARLARAEKPRSATREGTKHAQFNARGPARSKSGWGSKNEGVPEGSPEGSTLPAADDENFHRGSTRPPSRRLGVWSSERSPKEGRAPAYFQRLNI